mmetsp:Transcript_32864/g.68899  ORF Transcript_32864/g.68899 Transcript_32864/m.68899 type:complete len:217 (+) Transcript_32864:283-933(+)
MGSRVHIPLYNIEGRSATDSADQVRKKLSVAERRTERAGPKGIAFVFDVAFTNGSILQRMLQPEGMKRSKLDEFNKVQFCLKWASAVLCSASSSPFRQHRFQQHSALSSSSSGKRVPDDALLSQHSAVRISANHVLVDVNLELKAVTQRQGRGRPSKKAQKRIDRRGMCGSYDNLGSFVQCGRANVPKRTSLFCQECKRYFHLQCYFEHHYSCQMK